MKRKNHSASFKRKVALEAAKEQKTISEIASLYAIHPNQISRWKKQLLEGAVTIFESPAKDRKEHHEQEAIEARLLEKIGRLSMELEWLKKKLGHE